MVRKIEKKQIFGKQGCISTLVTDKISKFSVPRQRSAEHLSRFLASTWTQYLRSTKPVPRQRSAEFPSQFSANI